MSGECVTKLVHKLHLGSRVLVVIVLNIIRFCSSVLELGQLSRSCALVHFSVNSGENTREEYRNGLPLPFPVGEC